MSEIEEEGEDFLAQFKGQFASMDAMKDRLARERKAGRTPAQKARKGPPKKQVNFRATLETLAQLDALAKHMGESTTDVIAMAIDELHKAHLGAKK
jgi:hypothetical protein